MRRLWHRGSVHDSVKARGAGRHHDTSVCSQPPRLGYSKYFIIGSMSYLYTCDSKVWNVFYIIYTYMIYIFVVVSYFWFCLLDLFLE